MNRDGISRGLASIPSGVFVVAAEHDGTRYALLASFIQQAGFDPPTITVAIARHRPLMEAIRQTRRFTISTMSPESKASLKQFWKGVPEGTDPFGGLATETHDTGLPILADATAFLECELDGLMESGDHTVCVGRVLNGGSVRSTESMVRIRTDGFDY